MRVFRIASTPSPQTGHRLRLSFEYPFVETILFGGLKDAQPFEDNQFCWTPDDQQRLQSFIAQSPFIRALIDKPPSMTKLRYENI